MVTKAAGTPGIPGYRDSRLLCDICTRTVCLTTCVLTSRNTLTCKDVACASQMTLMGDTLSVLTASHIISIGAASY